MPSTSRSRASGAWITSANEPKTLSSAFAGGLVSRRGSAGNSASSSNS
jgi:hypothetical protein